MSEENEIKEVVREQYASTANLEARMRLHQRYSTNPQGWFSWYLDQLDLPSGSRILEIGCGPAALWQNQTRRIDPTWILTISDLSPGMIRAARDHTGGCLRYTNLDAQAIPFPDNSFDTVLANHMLYHVPDLTQAVAEIRRVLRPGGRLFAATNGIIHMRDLEARVERLTSGQDQSDPNHVSQWRAAFTLENGAATLRQRFEHVEVRRYFDDLNVTEARPLVDYILSMLSTAQQGITRQQIETFQSNLEDEIREKGSIFIRKDAGIFIAS